MSQFKETHLACEDCGSSDARSVYQSGVSICFACGERRAPDSVDKPTKGAFLHGEPHALRKRGLTEETCKRYGYIIADAGMGKVQVAPYYDAKTGALVAQKIRGPDKAFHVVGNGKKMGLFGIQLARTGGRMVVITEGEIDALSVSQAMGNSWPVLSLPNGASNLKALQDSLDLLESYTKVVLAFDNDDPGRTATEAALEMFSPGKAYVMSLGDYKDPNDMLVNGGPQTLRQAVWEAKEHRPDGIVDLGDMYADISAPLEVGAPYPWPLLNKLTFGTRPGELVTWTAGTGVGKTAVVSELEYHLLMTCEKRIGILHLEEGCVRSARRLVGIHMDKPVHLPDTVYTKAEFDVAFEQTLGTHRCHAYNHFGSLDDDVLLNRVRYLAKAKGCDTVFLDHVSMVVSGADLDADERRMLDRIVTRLKSLAEETGVTIHMVSHLSRQQGGKAHEEGGHVSLRNLRGTQAIGQLSDCVIALERDSQADDVTARNTTQLRVLKNRYSGLSGPADVLTYDHATGRLKCQEAQQHVHMTDDDY